MMSAGAVVSSRKRAAEGKDGEIPSIPKKPRKPRKVMLPKADTFGPPLLQNSREVPELVKVQAARKSRTARTTQATKPKSKTVKEPKLLPPKKGPTPAAKRKDAAIEKRAVLPLIIVDWLQCCCGTDIQPINPEQGVQCDSCTHWFHSTCIGCVDLLTLLLLSNNHQIPSRRQFTRQISLYQMSTCRTYR